MPSFTITAPTIGFGEVYPMPRFASSIALLIYCSSVIWFPFCIFFICPLKKPQTINVQGLVISNIIISKKYALTAFHDKSVKRYFEIKKSGMYQNTPEQISFITMTCAVSETESNPQLSILCIYHIHIFFHPDFTVGLGISPNHALRLVGYTTGRELHPALKNNYLISLR